MRPNIFHLPKPDRRPLPIFATPATLIEEDFDELLDHEVEITLDDHKIDLKDLCLELDS